MPPNLSFQIDANNKLRHLKSYTPAFRKPTDWTTWWLQFQSYACQRQFGEVIKAYKIESLPQNEVDFNSKGEAVKADPAHTEEQKEALEANAKGVSELYVAFGDHVTQDPLRFIKLSKTRNWPTGRCWIIIQDLIEEFQPNLTTGKVELDQALDKMHLDKNENPKLLFSQLVAVLNRYEDTIDVPQQLQMQAIMRAVLNYTRR